MDSINFSEFSTTGVNISDTFDTWRQKTNGVVSEIVDIRDSISPLFYATNQTSSQILRTVTIDTPQNITGTKTFDAGSSSAQSLKIGNVGLYESSGSLATTTPIRVSKLILDSQLQFGSYSYSIPSNDPAEASILGKTGNSLSWTTLDSIISQLQQEGAANVVSTNEILPVGSIVDYGPNGTPASSDWVRCTGTRFQGITYPALAAALLNKYDTIYTSQGGNTEAVPQGYNDNFWYTLPNIANALIKAKPDSVINTVINRGNVFDIVKSDNTSTVSLTIANGGINTLNLLHDSTLKVNSDRQLGLNTLAVTTDKIAHGAVDASKLSTGGPSWDSVSSILYEGNDPNTRKRVATREYVDAAIFNKGPASRLAAKASHSPYSSAPGHGEFCYINFDGVPIVSGATTASFRFGYIDKFSHCEMPLPDNRRAVELHVGHKNMCALDDHNELWVIGDITYNLFNIVPFAGSATGTIAVKTWVKAFTPLYTYGGENNKINKVIISGNKDIFNIAVIDNKQRLWIAGYNQNGILGRGNTTSTSAKLTGEADPILTNVFDACIIGSGSSATASTDGATCIALTSSGIRVSGYGAKGLRGDGLNPTAVNTTFNTVTLSGITDYSSCRLYAGGEDQSATAFITTQTGDVIYGWGSNGNGVLGDNTRTNKNVPTKIWENPDFIIDKLYTTSHTANEAAAYIFGSKANTTVKLGSDIASTVSGHLLGTSISCDDSANIIALGSPGVDKGRVKCYQYTSGIWGDYGATLQGIETSSNFGNSVSLNSFGTRLAVGIPDGQRTGGNIYGQVRIYDYSAGTWTQLGASLTGENKNLSKFGSKIALSGNGNVLIVGAPETSKTINGSVLTGVGQVFVYSIIGNTVSLLGQTIYGVGGGQRFGLNVAVNSDGTIIAIASSGGGNNGTVQVYTLNGTSWIQLGNDISGKNALENANNISLSGDGTRIAIGAPGSSINGANSGQVKVFNYDSVSSTWKSIGEINGFSAGAACGSSVALSRDGQTLAIGSPNADSGGITDNGYVRLYKLLGNSWKLLTGNIAGTNPGEKSGSSLAIGANGSSVIIGSPAYDANKGLVRAIAFSSTPTLVNELWCSGKNTGNKFGITGDSDQWRRAGQLPSGYSLVDFWCGNGYNSNTINIVKAYRAADDCYYLFACGANSSYQAGDGSNIALNTWTRINLSSDVVTRIVDVQIVPSVSTNHHTILLLDDGTLYFAGYNAYMIDPNLPKDTYRTDFTRIK